MAEEMITDGQRQNRNSILSNTPQGTSLGVGDPRSDMNAPEATVESLLTGMEYIRKQALYYAQVAESTDVELSELRRTIDGGRRFFALLGES